jgi:uncharacterized protein YaaQ
VKGLLTRRWNVKLILAIVRDDDAGNVVDALVEHGFRVTRLASTGGFLRAGNTILLSGVEDEQVDALMQIIQAHSEVRIHPPVSDKVREVQVSRAVVFVWDLERLEKL